MAKRTGAQTPIGIRVSSTFGAASAAQSGQLCYANSIKMDRNVSVLTANPIGSNNLMSGLSTQVGNDDPTATLNVDLGYDNSANFLIAQFLGSASVTSFGGATGGGIVHSLTVSESENQKFCTVAYAPTTTECIEAPSACVRKIDFSCDSFPGPVKAAFDMICDQRKIASTTNTQASLDALTIADPTRVIADKDDYFLINSSTDALSTSTDIVAITQFSISMERPQEHVAEMKGAAGHGVPRVNGDPPFKCTVSVTLRNLAALTYFTALDAGTAYKAQFRITGASAGQAVWFSFPYLKILADPGFEVGSAAENPLTVTFEALMAAAVPTGMLDVYPYVLITNNHATHLLT